MTTSVPGVDAVALTSWLDGMGCGTGDITLIPLAGGTQNIVVRVMREGFDAVLRRPPLHATPEHQASILREAGILEILSQSDVPHPRLLHMCADESVIGSAFFLMATIEGVGITTEPPPWVDDPEALRALSLSFVDAIAPLAQVDGIAVGLGSQDRVAGWPQRQVDRWLGQLERYERFEGWRGAESASLDDLVALLRSREHVSFQPGMIHGDYHVANTLVSRAHPQVAAIIDWELATFGDPLLDLAELLATWPRKSGRNSPTVVFAAPGLATAQELVAHYEQVSARSIEDLDWYYALACLRLGVLLEGTHARAKAGLIEQDVGMEFRAKAHALFDQGLRHWDW